MTENEKLIEEARQRASESSLHYRNTCGLLRRLADALEQELRKPKLSLREAKPPEITWDYD